MAQNKPRQARNTYRNDQCDDESVAGCLHAIDKVHSEERRYQRGEHHYNGHRCKCTHNGVHVVVDDA